MPSFDDRSTPTVMPEACVCVRTRATRSVAGSFSTDSSTGAPPKSCALTNRAALVSTYESTGRPHHSPYAPSSFSNCSCVPCSTIAPFAITAILSAFRIVESLWAMTIVVRPLDTRSRACCTTRSACGSSAEVASSRSSTDGSDTMLRAIAIRCF